MNDLQFDLQNIVDAQGLGIAATGMTIVFTALTLITLFITLLPRILQTVARVIPDTQGHAAPQSRPVQTDDTEIVAAIGFALHVAGANRQQVRTRKS